MEEEKQFLFYWDSTSPFSDDYMSEFVVDDIVFCFLNQYMLYKKADLFGDENKKKEALASNTPTDLNLVDQNVKNFDANTWYYDSYQFYKKGINAKYTQNESLHRILVESHPKFILRVPESSRSSIINADPSYLNSNELYERQWTDFLLMELRENIVFKDTALSIGFTHPANFSMAAVPDLYSDQHVSANNEQSCPKFQDVVEDALNSKEQQATPSVESGAESERQNPNPSQTMDSKEGNVIVDEKSYAYQSMQSTEDKHGNQDNERMENSREEYGQYHDNSSVVSEQQAKNSKTMKEQDDSVVETDSFLFFSGGDCPFSDDYICEFTVDGVTFRFMNQYLFYHKADFFRDDVKMKAALQIQNPKELAATDNDVESYDHWEWVKRRKSIYIKGLKAKFSQNEYLKNKLMESHSKIILHVPKRGNRQEIIEDGPEMANKRDFQNYFWKEMQLMSIRDKLVSGSTSMAGHSDNRTSASKNNNSNNGSLKPEKNNDTSSNPQTSKKENSARVSKKDPMYLKYKPSNLYFYNDKSGLSNGYQCTITLNYINFRSMDEYMLYRKAELFQDESVKEKILRGEDYDWDVKNFDRDVWSQKRKELYFEGIQAKFSQNQDLKDELLGTHPKTIVYANSSRAKDEIYYYGLDDWYMNRHHWSEVLQMKLRDELIAPTKSGMELPGSDSSETKQNTNATVSKKKSTRSGSRKFRKKDKKDPSQQSVDDNGDRTGDGHRNPDGETDFPEQVKSDEHIVVKVDSSGQRKTEIESAETENTGDNKKKQKEKQVNNNVNRTSDNNGSPNSTLSQLEKNGSNEGDSNQNTRTEEIVENPRSANSKSKTESSETPDAKTSSSEKGKGSKDSMNSKSKTWSRRRKPRPEKEKHVNYRNRTLENISKNNRCLLVKDGSELSSDFQCQINIDGVEFSSVTQYIQYCKAEHFQDDELKAEIMKATDARNGSVGELTVQNFDPEGWYADMAEDVTWSANEAKFTQNEELKHILYDTYPSIIQDMGTQGDTNVTLSRKAQRTHHRLKSILTELRDELMRSENLID